MIATDLKEAATGIMAALIKDWLEKAISPTHYPDLADLREMARLACDGAEAITAEISTRAVASHDGKWRGFNG